MKADCSTCAAALCCVIPPFDAVQGFGFDKPAETPCHHLCADHRCGIHDRLIAQGFAGCVAFDCLGAGQRLTSLAVTRFGSADWRARPEVARWLFAAYPGMRQAQEWLAQLSLAAAVSEAAELRVLAAELEPSRRAGRTGAAPSGPPGKPGCRWRWRRWPRIAALGVDAMYGLKGSLKAAAGRRAELTRLMLAEAGALPGCHSDVAAAASKAEVPPSTVKAVIVRAMPMFAAFAERRETRPVGGHAL